MGAGERKRERGRDDLVWGRGRERDGETYGRIEPGSRREKMKFGRGSDQGRGGNVFTCATYGRTGLGQAGSRRISGGEKLEGREEQVEEGGARNVFSDDDRLTR